MVSCGLCRVDGIEDWEDHERSDRHQELLGPMYVTPIMEAIDDLRSHFNAILGRYAVEEEP